MEIEYTPGLRLFFLGGFNPFPATVKSVNDQVIVVQFDDLEEKTPILLKHLRNMEHKNEVKLEYPSMKD